MKERKPVRTKEIRWIKAGGSYLLFNSKRNYSLDTISFLVWIQCDGKTSIEQIVDIFSVDGNRDIIKAAVVGILEKLAEAGLIRWT